MAAFLLRRSASALLLLLFVLSGTFFLLHLAPGDPAVIVEDPRVPPAQRAELHRLWGLDRPLGVQYLAWLVAAARGEWGYSFQHHRAVSQVLGEALPPTLLLAGSALGIEWLVGLPLGVAAARRRGRAFDHLVRGASLFVYSIPVFWLGLMAILCFSLRWPLFPARHLHAPDAAELSAFGRLADTLHHLVLPALALGLPSAAALARFVRASLLDALRQDFVLAARARGLGETRVVWRHALRNALGSLTQLFGLSLAFLLSGTLTVEVVFAWPGLGRVTFDALMTRDFPVVLASTAISAAMVVVGSLVADLLLAWADPRVRHG